MPELFITDISYLSTSSAQWLIGLDEVGRGPLAGPVTAAAVAIHRDWYNEHREESYWGQVNDSKKLTATVRENLSECAYAASRISPERFYFEIASASVEEIDSVNILEATKLAMSRALEALEARMFARFPRKADSGMFELGTLGTSEPEHQILVDGRELKSFPYRHSAMVKGDSKSFAIAMASILAKVNRDSYMAVLDKDFPAYAWKKNKGYGTAGHCRAIREVGPTAHHRRTFLRKLVQENAEA